MEHLAQGQADAELREARLHTGAVGAERDGVACMAPSLRNIGNHVGLGRLAHMHHHLDGCLQRADACGLEVGMGMRARRNGGLPTLREPENIKG